MFFNSDYNDLMPPVPEYDAPPPERVGLSGFFGILGSQCGHLLALNLLFLLGCVPVVTIPLSLYAMIRVVGQMVLDQPVRCVHDYWETFRCGWKQGYPAFFLTTIPLGVAGVGMWFYLGRVTSSPLFFLPFLFCSTVFLVTLLSSGYLYGLLGRGYPIKEAVRSALLLGVAKPLRAALAALSSYGLTLLAILYFPLSGLYLALIGFTVPCLLGSFYLRTVLKHFPDQRNVEP